MKALSIHQPWANLIVQDKRVFEIRSWAPKYRGRLVIHAGLTVEKEECKRLGITIILENEVGCLLGTVDLIEIKRLTEKEWETCRPLHLEVGSRPYGDNTFAWRFENSYKFPVPIKYKGRLGLFTVSISNSIE
ncbi:ASCH domain-containing protein [Patescibacteria group bacterium AH-259-L05]|nr:ASCH domain-containing protein [Patescibacteria group bacterium AH-259-L05]